MNKLKTKIYITLISLLAVILLLGVFGSIFIYELASDSKAIIQDNYKTIEYINSMSRAADNIQDLYILKNYSSDEYDTTNISSNYKKALSLFEENLIKEEDNITEQGEKELVIELKQNYINFKKITNKLKNPSERLAIPVELNQQYGNLTTTLGSIYRLNMDAISHKSNKAESTAKRVSYYMIIASSAASLISFVLLLYFLNYILRPLYQLTEKIRKISEGNYIQQLPVTSNNEIGQLASAFNAMSLKLQEYEQNNIHKLLTEKKRLETIIQNLNDAVIIIDENKIILYVNRAALILTGLTETDLIGKYAPDTAANNDLIRELIKGLMNAELNNEEEPIHIVVDHKELYYAKDIISISIPSNSNDKTWLAGHILILKNITHFEERNTAKTNLIATVSHELKTPLSSINLSLKLLENPKIGGMNIEQKKIIQSIRQQSGRLAKMVNELLDFSQAESGNIRLRMNPVNPIDIVDYATTALMILIGEKNIHLETQFEDNIPLINVDLEKTVWVLTNLINNAIRYTPENGTIKIIVKKEIESVIFSIIDQGQGISPEDQEKLFNRFVQVGINNSKGRGLGLAISKEFVTAQGGDIWVASELGTGSTFSFKLPAI